MREGIFTHFSEAVGYSVGILKKIGSKFYHLNELFEGREDSLRNAYRENQLSFGEIKGLVRFLDDNLGWNDSFAA